MIAAAVANYYADLAADFTYSDATGGNVFLNRMPATPDVAMGVFSTGGLQQATLDASDAPTVQARFRGPERQSRAPYEAARAFCAAMAGLDLVWLDEGGPDEVFVIACTPLQSDPVPLGQDGSERFEFVVNLALQTHAPTVHRPATTTP